MTSATAPLAHSGTARSNPSMTLLLNGKMKNRTEIYAADLYVLLQREFRRRQAPDCTLCYVQLPFRVDRQDPRAANWEVVMPPPCPLACGSIIHEIVSALHQLYDLKPAHRAPDRRMSAASTAL